jgi:AcrR family transcriptional regulator
MMRQVLSEHSVSAGNGGEVTRKETILEVALKLFAEKGFSETTVSEISEASGVAEGTIFYHFKSKEDLLLSILERLKEDIVGEFKSYLKTWERRSGLASIDEAISFYLDLAGKLETPFLLLHRHYPHKLAQQNVLCRSYLQEIYSCLVDIFEETIVLGQRDGSVAPLPARKVALLVFAMVDGLVRFKNYQLYDPAALYSELIIACRRLLENGPRSVWVTALKDREGDEFTTVTP